MTLPIEHGPDVFVAFMTNMLRTAEAEIVRRISTGDHDLTMPSQPIAALRLLHEYFTAIPSFRCTSVNPSVFAQMLHLLAFDDRIAPSDNWPFSKAEMRAEFISAGLTGDAGEIHPISYPTLRLLIGSDQYKYALIKFDPPIEDLRVTEIQQARVVTEIAHENGGISISVSSVVNPAITGPTGATVFAFSNGGRSEFTIKGETICAETMSNVITQTGDSAPQSLLTEEYARLYDDSSARTTTRNTPAGVLIERDVRLQRKYKQNKSLEERTAGQLFISTYNSINGTDLQIKNAEADEEKDLDAIGSGGATAFPIQVRKCCASRVWRDLAQRNSYSDTPSEQEAVAEILSAVRNKAIHYGDKSKLYLLLDGGWLGFTAEVMESIMLKHSAELENAGFKEIWYISRISNHAVRLFPA